MDVIGLAVTGPGHEPLGTVTDFTMDCAWGKDENDFTLELSGIDVGEDCLVMVDGTEIGGIVDRTTVDTATGTLTCSGRTWHGILASKILTPDQGMDYLTVGGDAADVLRRLIARIGLTDLFGVASETRGITIANWRFNRYVDAYTGIRSMLRAFGAKLAVTTRDGRVIVSAVRATAYGDDVDSDRLDFTAVRTGNPVNHLVCLGEGELRDRVVIDLYADAKGDISTSQTLFGLDERAAVYDYNNATRDELEKEGRRKLKELQSTDGVDVSIDGEAGTYDVGDTITARDNRHGITVTAEIAKKIAKIGKGTLTVSYEAGDAAATGMSLSGTAESTPGGHAYYAGAGLKLDGWTFSAEIGAADLEQVSKTASEAARQVSGYTEQIGRAQAQAAAANANADARVKTIAGVRPVTAVRSGDAVMLTAPGTLADGIRLASQSLDDIKGAAGAGAYWAPGGNGVAGKPPGVQHFGLLVIRSAMGVTTQLLADPAAGRIWQRAHNGTAWTAWTALAKDAAATQSASGLLTAADKTKLDGIAANANRYTLPVASETTLGGVKPDGTTVTVGTDGTISAQAGGAASFLAAHPVGSLYWTASPASPGAEYGGTWQTRPSLNGYIYERMS